MNWAIEQTRGSLFQDNQQALLSAAPSSLGYSQLGLPQTPLPEKLTEFASTIAPKIEQYIDAVKDPRNEQNKWLRCGMVSEGIYLLGQKYLPGARITSIKLVYDQALLNDKSARGEFTKFYKLLLEMAHSNRFSNLYRQKDQDQNDQFESLWKVLFAYVDNNNISIFDALSGKYSENAADGKKITSDNYTSWLFGFADQIMEMDHVRSAYYLFPFVKTLLDAGIDFSKLRAMEGLLLRFFDKHVVNIVLFEGNYFLVDGTARQIDEQGEVVVCTPFNFSDLLAKGYIAMPRFSDPSTLDWDQYAGLDTREAVLNDEPFAQAFLE